MRAHVMLPGLLFLGFAGGGGCGGGTQNAPQGLGPAGDVRVAMLERQLSETKDELRRERDRLTATQQSLAEVAKNCAPSGQPQPHGQRVPDPHVKTQQPPPANAMIATIVEFGAKRGDVRIVVNKGSDQGVAVGWIGEVLRGRANETVAVFEITEVKKTEAIGIAKGESINTIGSSSGKARLRAP